MNKLKISKSSNKNQIKQVVKSLIDEKIGNTIKYVDFTGNTSGVVGGVQAFTLPAVGTGVDERIGEAIVIDHIDCRISYDQTELTNVGATTASNTFIRLTIVQVIGEEVITASDVYDNTASSAGVIVSPISYSNNKKLFHVLYDEIIALDTFNRSKFLRFKLKPSISKLRYDTPNNVWSTGEPYILTSYYSDGSNPAIRQVWQFRTWYYNM